MKRVIFAIVLAACGHDAADIPAPDGSIDATVDAAIAVDAPVVTRSLGTVTNVHPASCPGAPPTSTCQQLTVVGCPELDTEPRDAIVAIVEPTTTLAGTIVHFKGGGGEGYQETDTAGYAAAGYRQVFVSWTDDWELTTAAGIKAAACRPATVIEWAFDTVHQASRDLAFCGEGFSGGSGQLGYALAHYGMGDKLDYVNELSGPPFARIDLGCDGDAPRTATVCGASVTMQLPSSLNAWEIIPAPLSCGATGVPASELLRWKNDSIAIGGVYSYPNTRVEFFDCTNHASAVTAMAQIYYDEVAAASDPSLVSYHCYAQADGCMGEALGNGSAAAVTAMTTSCKPRHR